MRRGQQGSGREEPIVYIVDDDDSVRDSLGLLLGTVDLTARTYSTASEFLDRYDPQQHGCLVADIRMPGMNGLELQRELNKRGASTPLVFITGNADVPMAVDAMQSGALDFIEKPFRDQDLLDRVQQALATDKEQRGEDLKRLEIRRRLASLTPRETQVMERVVEGNTNYVTAREFGTSVRTIEIHRARVMEKMGVRTVPALVRAVEAARS